MIIGYEAITDEEQRMTYDYIGCLYPEGVIAPDKNLLFNHEQIEKIFNIGFSDEEDLIFKKKLKELVNVRNESNNLNDKSTLEVFDLNNSVNNINDDIFNINE